MTTKIIKTDSRRFHRDLQERVKLLLPNWAKTKTKYVAGIGNVHYFYSDTGQHLGNACLDQGYVTIRINVF